MIKMRKSRRRRLREAKFGKFIDQEAGLMARKLLIFWDTE